MPRTDAPLGQPAPWNIDSPAALRQIAAGMALLSDKSGVFSGPDWALFSGIAPTEPLAAHQLAFRTWVEAYFAKVYPYTEPGTDGPGKPLAIPGDDDSDQGDYDFPLRDIIAIIHIFVDEPSVLSNEMIRSLLGQGQIKFVDIGPTSGTAEGDVPYSGQDLEEWLGAGPGGRHYFIEKLLSPSFPVDLFIPDPTVKMAAPETENHQLAIYAWRFLVNEYLTFVSLLQPGHHRYDPCLQALVGNNPGRYHNGPAIFDWVLQLLGRVVHSGMFETNAKPYGAYSITPILAFFQAADRLFPTDAERHKVKTAARNALDYLAAEFAFQSLHGKRMMPLRRNVDHRDKVSFYESDYLPHLFGVLTGAYVFDDDEVNGPFVYSRIGQEGGFALWALLSGYRVPRGIHDFMLNKHGGYFTRIQTRYSTSSYEMDITLGTGGPGPIGGAPTPRFCRPRYFQGYAEDPGGYDVVGPGDFAPVTQFAFTTRQYLNSAGGHNRRYYFDFEIPKAVVDAILLAVTGVPFIPGIRDILTDFINDKIRGTDVYKKLRGSDVYSRPTTLIGRGNPQFVVTGDDPSVVERADAFERELPTMRGQDEFFSSKNLTVYKSLAVGYTFNPDDSRHQMFPQRYPAAWNDLVREKFSIHRADFWIFDFRLEPDHPLSGHYWIVSRFAKSVDLGQFREYGRGLWEVVPGYRFPNPAALRARIEQLNPEHHFDDNEANNYRYRMATTGETIVIHNRFGSTATEQAFFQMLNADGFPVPINRHSANNARLEELRELPLMDVWQVDRDYEFTGRKYAYADGHGRVVVNNPFVGENLTIDAADYRFPARSVSDTNLTVFALPPLPNTAGQVPAVSALATSGELLFATQYYLPEGATQSSQPGELVMLNRADLSIRRKVTVGRSPHAIAVHESSGMTYVLNYEDISLSIVEGHNFTLAHTMTFPGFALIEVAVSQKHHRVYITQPGQKRLIVVDGATRTQLPDLANLPVTGPVVIDQETDRMYVSVTNPNPKRQDIVEFEITADGQHELRRVTVDNQVSRPAKLALDQERLYVLNSGALAGTPPNTPPGQKVTIIDRQSHSEVRQFPLITGGGLGIGASGSQGILVIATISNFQVLDSQSGAVLRTYPVTPQPKGAVAVVEASGEYYFGGGRSDKLHGTLTVPMGF
ncbi:hypothetical protein AB0F81_41275 [Actinoplanes sp. NPDC024001]|uniref:YncE family protein n=1 Tax=Actinoplanes sp. NPDC024001 TaxID=3154598 RepID=UPI0033E5B3DD